MLMFGSLNETEVEDDDDGRNGVETYSPSVKNTQVDCQYFPHWTHGLLMMMACWACCA